MKSGWSARRQIIETANKHRDPMSKPYSMRRIQDAVCMVRRQKLIDDQTLRDAGFRTRG